MQHILDYAQRIPFALPFNLFFRVDPSATLVGDPVTVTANHQKREESSTGRKNVDNGAPIALRSVFAEERAKRLAEKSAFFDLAAYCGNDNVVGRPSDGDAEDETSKQPAVLVLDAESEDDESVPLSSVPDEWK